MISGMSRENPVEERVRCIERIWSAYEVTGVTTRKTGAAR